MELSGSRFVFYDTFSDRDLEPDRRRGKEDGEVGLPPDWVDTFQSSEQEIVGKSRADLSDYLQEIEQHRSRLQTDHDEKLQRMETFNGRRGVQLVELKARMEALRREIGDGSPRYEQAKRKFDDASAAFRSKGADAGRALGIYLGGKSYYLVFGLLSFAEVPINYPAITQVFREIALLAMSLSVIIGLLLMVLAHTIGRLIRTARFARTQGQGVAHHIFLILSIIINGALVWLLYKLRVSYAAEVNLGGDLSDTASAGYLFLLYNAAVVLIGTILSFLHHDPDPDFQAAYLKLHRTEKLFEQMKDHYAIEQQKLQREFNAKNSSSAREAESLRAEVDAVGKALAGLQRRRDRDVMRIIEVLTLRLTAYQSANIGSRGAAKAPSYFGRTNIDLLVKELRKEFLYNAAA